MRRITKAIHRMQWRVRYTLIGYRRLRWWGISGWWGWSDTDYDEFADLSTPYEAVTEELQAMAASQ